jgi:pimeloyl-ACP methyl ester carboxylesterase
MSAKSVRTSSSPAATQGATVKGHIGLVVLASIAAGLTLGLVLVLAVFAGADEPRITGSALVALVALGAGFALLAIASARYTSQPQPWARVPGVASTLAGVVVALMPTGHAFDIAGWVWPVLLATLVVSSFRGARRSLANWSRRALLYPALVVLSLIAVGGAAVTVMAATASNPAPTSGHTYLVNGNRLYLNCTGSGSPTVILFNGLSERTPSWAWVQANVSTTTRVCSFDRAGEGWSGGKATAQNGPQMASDAHVLLAAAHVPGPYVVAGHSVGGTYALVYAEQYPSQIAGVALIDSSTPYQFDLPEYPGDYSMMKRAYALMPTIARTAMGKMMLRSGHGTLPPQARNAARSFASSPARAARRPDRAPTAADDLQRGAGAAHPQRQAARRRQRRHRRDARLDSRPEQARPALDEQHPPHRRRRNARDAARRQGVRRLRERGDYPRRGDGTVNRPLTARGA